ncbi:hypothetical protein ACLMAL_23600 [Nocardia sp. CWNU-33]|uniref:hypothetical protein n=1 Tax=Nocardia sp. CWNU-33 TaxID=3392117 RepID=UPI00398F53D4
MVSTVLTPGAGRRVGPVLISETRMLAMSSRHPLAARTSISLEDLATVGLLRMPGSLPAAMVDDRAPRQTPSGRPIARAGVGYSGQEILARVGAGEAAFVVGAHMTCYHMRPDVAYVPIDDAPPSNAASHGNPAGKPNGSGPSTPQRWP